MTIFNGLVSSLLGSVASFLMTEPIIYFVGCFILLIVCAAFGKLIHINH